MKDQTAVMCHNIAKYDREHPTPEIAPRLIDANAVTKILRARYDLKADTDRPIATGIDLAIGIVDDAPTIGAVPVVRCGECKMGERMPITDTVICQCMNGSVMGVDDFCSCGARKDGDPK